MTTSSGATHGSFVHLRDTTSGRVPTTNQGRGLFWAVAAIVGVGMIALAVWAITQSRVQPTTRSEVSAPINPVSPNAVDYRDAQQSTGTAAPALSPRAADFRDAQRSGSATSASQLSPTAADFRDAQQGSITTTRPSPNAADYEDAKHSGGQSSEK